jgi:hypothetical protein
MATVSFTDNDATNKDILFRQYVSQPLEAGQTVTGSQALKGQCRVAERATSCNLFFTVGIRVIASDGSTLRKLVIAPTRDATEAATSLTNRQWTGTSAATNYTTQAGDRLVIEIGMAGDPNAGSDHDSDMRLGDAAGSDLAEDNASTTDNRPWVELTDTLAFVYTASASVSHGAATGSGSATFAVPTFTGSSSVTRGPSTAVASGEFVAESFHTAQASVTRAASTASAAGGTSEPHPVSTLTQPIYGIMGRRYGDFSGKTVTPPYAEGVASVTRGATTCTASGWASAPHPVAILTQPRFGLMGARYGSFADKGAEQFTGAASVTRGATTAHVTGTNVPPTSTATASLTRGATTATGEATRTTPTFTAAASVVTGGRTANAAAASSPPTYTGSASVTTGAATASGSAIFATAVYQGEADVSVGAATANGSANFFPVLTGAASVQRGGTTANAAATFTVPVYTASASVTRGATIANATDAQTGGSLLLIRRRKAAMRR